MVNLHAKAQSRKEKRKERYLDSTKSLYFFVWLREIVLLFLNVKFET